MHTHALLVEIQENEVTLKETPAVPLLYIQKK